MKNINKKLKNHIELIIAITAILSATFGLLLAYGAGNTQQVTGTLTVSTLCSFTTNTNGGIAFYGNTLYNGNFIPGTNSLGNANTMNIINTGSVSSNLLVSGSNWINGGNLFFVQNTIYSKTSNTYYAGNVYSIGNVLSGNEIYLTGATSDTGIVISNTANPAGVPVYLGVAVPSGVVATGAYTQTINVISSC